MSSRPSPLRAKSLSFVHYEELRRSIRNSPRCCETPDLLSEEELQALWFAGSFGREFITTKGEQVSIIQFGEWNHAAGPDFRHAAVSIGDQKAVGPIELDCHPADWELHGHAQNPAFEKVVLHVVFATGRQTHFTRSPQGREIPCVVVPQDTLEAGLDKPVYACADSRLGRCAEPLRHLSVERVNYLLQEAASFRMNRKARALQCLEEIHGFEDALWQSLARALGYGPNKLVMTLLGQRVSRRLLRSLRTHAQREAVLFGVAGFLSPDLHQKAHPGSRQFLSALWRDWWKLRAKHEPDRAKAFRWQLSGIRPSNHPHRRLAALAAASVGWNRLSRPAQHRSRTYLERLRTRLAGLDHPFWANRYTLRSQPTKKPIALCGENRATEFVVNYSVPRWWFNDPEAAWDYLQTLRSSVVSDPVRRAATRLFGNRRDRRQFLRHAWQHQALLQLYHDFCLQDSSDCEDCPFPEQLQIW